MSRAATKSAARRRKEDAANKSGRAQACPDGAPSGAPRFREGLRAHNYNGCAPWRAIPLIFEGRNEEDYGVPGAAKKQGGGALAHGCLTIEYERPAVERTPTPHPRRHGRA